jgi:hypothetical protein
MHTHRKASFLSDKPDHSSLHECTHLTAKDIINGFQLGKVDVEGDKERNKESIDEQMKWTTCSYISLNLASVFIDILKTDEMPCFPQQFFL